MQASQFFDSMNKKVDECRKEFESRQCGIQLVQLTDNLQSNIRWLSEYLRDIQIYFVFMGTTSAGKSTLINSLIGSELLPSRNQICTQQVIKVQYSENIQINGEQFSYLNAQEQLIQMQNNQYKYAEIATPSVFHSKLDKDLRSRVTFVDTPGLNLSTARLEDYQKHFQTIDDCLLELKLTGIRINLWIGNYTTFDSDWVIQQKMIAQLQESHKIRSAMNFLQDLEEETYLERTQSSPLDPIQIPLTLYIVNKFDEHKVQDSIENINKAMSDQTHFKLSAINILRYNILNYGQKEVQTQFMNNLYKNYKNTLGFNSLMECKTYCSKLKNNIQLLHFQDYNKFINSLDLLIKDQISRGFYGESLNNVLQDLAIVRMIQTSQVRLTEGQRSDLHQLLDTFPEWISGYNAQTNNLQHHFQQLNQQSIKDAQSRLSKSPKETLQHIYNQSIAEFAELNRVLMELTNNLKEKLLDKLRAILDTPLQLDQSVEYVGPVSSIMHGCEQIYKSFSDSHIYQYQAEAFKRYSNELHSRLGVKLSTKAYFTGMSIGTLFAMRFAILGTIVTGPLLIQSAIQILNEINREIDLDLAELNLESWSESLDLQITDLVSHYRRVYIQTLDGIENLLMRISN